MSGKWMQGPHGDRKNNLYVNDSHQSVYYKGGCSMNNSISLSHSQVWITWCEILHIFWWLLQVTLHPPEAAMYHCVACPPQHSQTQTKHGLSLHSVIQETMCVSVYRQAFFWVNETNIFFCLNALFSWYKNTLTCPQLLFE